MGVTCLTSDHADRVVVRHDIDSSGDAAGGQTANVWLVRINPEKSFAPPALPVDLRDAVPIRN